MRYDNEELQERLAAEFVLGSLRGAARRRFNALMRYRPDLRRRVERWEDHAYPLLMNGPVVQAPGHVWRAIQARIGTHRRGVRAAPMAWRIALAGFAVAAAALVYVVSAPPGPPPFVTVAVLNNSRAQPGILVSWTSQQAAQRRLRARILAHPDMPTGTSWQAWLVTATDATPISLGLVTGAESQMLELSPAAAAALPRAAAIGVSVEAKGGSASGRPSGPFLFQGPALRLDG